MSERSYLRPVDEFPPDRAERLDEERRIAAEQRAADQRVARRLEEPDVALERAEQAVLGAMMLRPDLLTEMKWLEPSDFYDPRHGDLLTLMHGMHERGEPIDPVTVVGQMRRQGLLRNEAGTRTVYVLELAERVPVAATGPAYGRIVLEASLHRELEKVGVRIQQAATVERGDLGDAFATAREQLSAVEAAEVRWEQAQPQPQVDGAGLG